MRDEQNRDLKTLNEWQLVVLARQGDQEAFSELVGRNWRKCVNLASCFVRNRGDAEDQAQEAFIKAYEHLDQFHGEAEFSTWLGRIVGNECLMLMRLRRRARFFYLDEVPSRPEAMPVQLAAAGPDPEGELALRQLTERLRAEVERIPRLLRTVMLLHDIEGRCMVDVAARLEITVAAAKSRLGRARAELRQRMIPYYAVARGRSPLSRTAAPLNRVGRHCLVRAAS